METVTLQLSGSYWGSSRYASVDGQTLTAAGSYQVNKDATVTLTLTPLSAAYTPYIYLNGASVGRATQYVFRATANAKIDLSVQNFSELYCNITMPS